MSQGCTACIKAKALTAAIQLQFQHGSFAACHPPSLACISCPSLQLSLSNKAENTPKESEKKRNVTWSPRQNICKKKNIIYYKVKLYYIITIVYITIPTEM